MAISEHGRGVVTPPGSVSQLCHSLAVRLWANRLTVLSLAFLLSGVGRLVAPPRRRGSSERTLAPCSGQCRPAGCPQRRKVLSFLACAGSTSVTGDEAPTARARLRLRRVLLQHVPCHAGAGLVLGTGSPGAGGSMCLGEPAVGPRGPVGVHARPDPWTCGLRLDRLHLSSVTPGSPSAGGGRPTGTSCSTSSELNFISPFSPPVGPVPFASFPTFLV